MAPSSISDPRFDVTVRVGCSLAYEVTGTAWLLLNLKLRPDRNHASFSSARLRPRPHGRGIYRQPWQPGSPRDACARLNSFRQRRDRLVSSRPDNHDLPPSAALSPGELPPAVLRYTLPSRYCDSDKLTNFAWEKFGQVEHGWPRVQAISQWLHDNTSIATCPAAPISRPGMFCSVVTACAGISRIRSRAQPRL